MVQVSSNKYSLPNIHEYRILRWKRLRILFVIAGGLLRGTRGGQIRNIHCDLYPQKGDLWRHSTRLFVQRTHKPLHQRAIPKEGARQTISMCNPGINDRYKNLVEMKHLPAYTVMLKYFKFQMFAFIKHKPHKLSKDHTPCFWQLRKGMRCKKQQKI